MEFVKVSKSDAIATLILSRGKFNALNLPVVGELRRVLQTLEADDAVRAIIVTGRARFFSFGFDIAELLPLSREEFSELLVSFMDFYTALFLYPKPVIAALNGHAVGGGCILALACDYRIMVDGDPKIALNDIRFNSSVFSGGVEMLRFWIGNASATDVLYFGSMYSAREACSLGLVQQVCTKSDLMSVSRELGADLASKYSPAFASMKMQLRRPIAEEMMRRERPSINEIVDIWYSEATWKSLQAITIHA